MRADDKKIGRYLWRAAAESFVEKNKESVARIKITTDILTKSTRDDVALRAPDIGVGLRLNEMAKVVYVLAGIIKRGHYDESQSHGSAHGFFALPK